MEGTFVDLVAEIGVAEGIAGGPDIGGGDVRARCHGNRNHRDLVREINLLAGHAIDSAAHSDVAAIRRGRLAFGRRGVAVEFELEPAGTLPLQVAADRTVDRAVGRDRTGDGKVLVLARTEIFCVEIRSGDRAVGPAARGVVVVEPHADAVVARFDSVLREGVVDSGGQRVGGLHLQHRLAVVALAARGDEVVTGVLRHLIDVVRAGTVLGLGKVAAPVVGVHRQRAPVILIPLVAFAPARGDLRLAVLAVLVRAADENADAIIGKGIADDARDFRCDRLVLEARGVIDALHADRTVEARAIQRTRGLDVDHRADATGRQRGAARLVDFDARNAFGREVAEIEAARIRRAGRIAER